MTPDSPVPLKWKAVLFLAWTLALAGCPREPKVDPKDRAEGLYVQGTSAYLQGQFDQALQAFEEVKALSPQDPRLPAAVGEVYLAQGKLDEAAEEFARACQLDPARGTSWSRLGFIQSQQGKPVEARTSLGRAVELNPGDFNALEQLGELGLRKGELDAGVDLLVRAAEKAPARHKAELLLRAVEALLTGGHRAEAVALLRSGASRGVTSAEVFSRLGELLVEDGNLAGALQAYSDGARVDTADPALWELVGELELRLGQPARAEVAFRESLRIQERALPHLALARLLHARGDGPGADRELERALQSATGEESRESRELAATLASFGKKQDALKLYALLAAEPEAAQDVELQRVTARLARELGATPLVQEACGRVRSADAGTTVCP